MSEPGAPAPVSKAASRLRRALFADTGRSLSERARARRWAELAGRFPDLAAMDVVDLGGTTWNWTMGPARPRSVLVVNLDPQALTNAPQWMSTVAADVCDLPDGVTGRSFDLVFSNSVIEHVGGRWRRRAFAATVRRLAPHHWVQTPARSFPLEPHWMFPGFQFLPVAARAAVSRRWPLAPPELRVRSAGEAVDDVLDIELVSAAELRRLFPDSELVRERAAGLTKSFIAVR